MRTPARRPARAFASSVARALLRFAPAAALLAAAPAPAPTRGAPPAGTPPAGVPPAKAPPPARVVTITARDYAFEMPDTLVAGRTELRLANQGAEMHHAWLVRMDAEHTPAEFFAVIRRTGQAPSWAQQVGGPNTPRPGGVSAAVVDLAPGRYLALCGMPAANGQTHLRLGMLKTFVVVPAPAVVPARFTRAGATGGAAGGAVSAVGAPSVTLTLTDAGFTLSQPLEAGRHVLRIRNQGAMVHEVIVARLKPGVTAERALDWLGTARGAAPFTPLGGAVGLARGETNDVPIALTPGEYALLCRQPDLRATRGNPGTHRMMQQFTVK